MPDNYRQKNMQAENIKLFHKLFGHSKLLFEGLCSDSWEKSSFYFVKHPTPRQIYKEAKRYYNIIKGFTKNSKNEVKSEPEKLEDFLVKDFEKAEVKPKEEFIEIFGLCLWDIFSNNNEVVASNGTIHDIGSFRGAGRFIADFINLHIKEIKSNYDYIDFYLGSTYISNRVDLKPAYENIFSCLKREGCDWIYSFPRLGIIDFTDMHEALDSTSQDDMLEYDPGKSLRKDLERKEQKKEIEELREALEQDYRDAVEKAKFEPLPKTVQAYKNIYRKLPRGWPHK